MEQSATRTRSQVLYSLALRRTIGVIGVSLPFVLALGKLAVDGPGIECSISTYYYTSMRDVFVGALSAIGVLLFSYTGYERRDAVAGKLGALSAFGLALLPTAPDFSQLSYENTIGTIHLLFSAAFFTSLAYFSLYLFTKTHSNKKPTVQKLRRNTVYLACGIVIVLAMVLIIIVKLLPQEAWQIEYAPVFWLESVAVVAFGISWLVKGELLFRDKTDACRDTAKLSQRRGKMPA